MKKSLKLLVVPAAMVLLAGNITSCAPSQKEVAMISDVGDIDDGSFNQSCWEGVKEYCTDNHISYDYYRPFADSDFARKCAIKQAIAKGAKIVILPGFKFSSVAKYASTNQEYIDKGIKFVLIDEFTDDEKTPDNLICIKYDFVYSGWLAGYCVAKDYYIEDWETSKKATGKGKLHDQYGFGFVGGNSYPSVYPFGYGFIEGVLYATEEFVVENTDSNKPLINFKTSYAGAFMQDDLTCANVKGWLSNEKEPIQCVFPCGGKLYQSITEAVSYYNDHNLSGDKRNYKDQEAPREAARWIGVDGDQYKLLHSEEDKRSIYTSCLKDLGHTVKVCIKASRDEDAWKALRHVQGTEDTGQFTIGLGENHIVLKDEETEYDYVGIPLDKKEGSDVLRSFNHVTQTKAIEMRNFLKVAGNIEIYDGTKEFEGYEPGVFKSLGSDKFKKDTKYNVYKHGVQATKYQNYTVE